MLELTGGLLLAALPALPILLWLLHLDRERPEPLHLVGKSLVYGFLAVAPAAALEALLFALTPRTGGLFGRALEAFLLIALVEEGSKFLFLRHHLRKRREFDEAADGIVYAVSLSLGFAIVENFLYTYGRPDLLVLRSVTAVPLHAIATGFLGFWLGLERRRILGSGGLALPAGGGLRGLAVAVATHGSYDFFLLLGSHWSLLIFPLLVWGGFRLRKLFAIAKTLDDSALRMVDSDEGAGR